MTRVDGLTVIDRALVAVAPAESRTCAVKFDVPAAVGRPESAPLPPSAIPAGNAPDVIDHVLPPEPPVDARVDEYGAPTVAAGREAVEIVRDGGSTTM